MGFVELVIVLVSGAVGGNVAGAVMPNKSLGMVGNSIAGIVGGGVGGSILHALGLFTATGAGMSFMSIVADVVSGGVGGAVVMVIVAVIKHMMNKS